MCTSGGVHYGDEERVGREEASIQAYAKEGRRVGGWMGVWQGVHGCVCARACVTTT